MQNSMANVFGEITKTPWRGIITEIGFGMTISHNYLFNPENSSAVLSVSAPLNTNFGSSQNLTEESNIKGLLNYTQNLDQSDDKGQEPRFYLALSGVHKTIRQEGENQGWIGLRTSIPRDSGLEISDTLIHFKISKNYQNLEIPTEEVYSLVNILASWLLKAMLLGHYNSWTDAVNNLPYSKFIHLDVIRDSRISDQEHLVLASLINPLVFINGKFEKATETIRSYSEFVTDNSNLKIENSLRIRNLGKDEFKFSDSDLGNTLFLKDCSYIPFQVDILRKILKNQSFTITTDCETFNKIFDPYAIPGNNSELFSGMSSEKEKEARDSILSGFLKSLHKDSGVSFRVLTDSNDTVIESTFLENINFKIENF